MSVITTEQEIARLTALTNELKIKLKAEQDAEKVKTVSFATKHKLAAALADGRTFNTPNGMSLGYDDTAKGSPYLVSTGGAIKDDGVPMNGSWESFNNLVETTPVVPWYLKDNFLPVECYVSDNDSNPGYEHGSATVMIGTYYSDCTRPFEMMGGALSWRYATPTGK
jgi:hypothetical protein